MLAQADGPKALLARGGVNVGRLQTALDAEIAKLPQVQGGESVQPGRDLTTLLQATEKEATRQGDQFIASEMFLLASTDAKSSIGAVLKQNGVTRKALEAATPGGRVRLLADDPMARIDVPHFVAEIGAEIVSRDEVDGGFSFLVAKP